MKKILIMQDMPLQPYRVYIYNNLADRGYTITTFALSNKDVSFDIPLKFKYTSIKFSSKCGFTKAIQLPQISPDDYDAILVAPNLRVLDFYKFYGDKFRNKVILWGHHKGRTSNNRYASVVRSLLSKRAKALLFYDFKTMEEYKADGYDSEKLFVANNTQYVDISKVDISKPRRYFLYVGRLQERKRVDIAIRAFSMLKEQYKDDNLKFLIVGGGDNKSLKEIVDETHVSGVEFVGPVYGEEKLQELFSEAIAYVSPGPVGLGVLHAFAFGVPVITCTTKGHGPEVNNCKEDNSFMVELTDKAVEDAMEKLYTDKELQHTMAINCHNHYKDKCTLGKMVDGIEAAIKYITK